MATESRQRPLHRRPVQTTTRLFLGKGCPLANSGRRRPNHPREHPDRRRVCASKP